MYAQDYRGTGAGSEPETQALMKLAKNVRPAAYLSYHSFSELVLYPYGCNNKLTPEDVMVARVAREMANRLKKDRGTGKYTPGPAWKLLYSVDGDSMGHMYGMYGALSYTFEINMDFQPSYAIRDETVTKQRNAWMYFLNFVNDNLLKVVVIDGRTNQTSAQAKVEIDQIAHQYSEPGFFTNAGGRFFKVLDAGRYVVTAKLADGRTANATVTMAGQPQTLTLTVN
jgi:hypothetical protein